MSNIVPDNQYDHKVILSMRDSDISDNAYE